MLKSNIRDQKSYVKKAYTIPEFCDAYSISRSKFYEMRKAGSGPRIMKVGRRTLISVEAATAWRRRLEASSRPGVRAHSEDGT
jgi:predicted DNA-binding transcriptional regulator AlpA